jgi:small-conductance mechanosensitive channel
MVTSFSLVSVLVAAVVAFILGFLFHGPLTGKLWMKLADIHPTGNEKLSEMIPQMLWNLLANFVSAFVLAGIIWMASTSVAGPLTSGRGAILGVWVAVGFIATSTSMEVIWMKRSYKLWLFEAACSTVVMAVMGAILAGWAM